MADLILGPEETPDDTKGIRHDVKVETVPIILDRQGDVAQVTLTPEEKTRHHRVKQHMQQRRERKAEEHLAEEAGLAPEEQERHHRVKQHMQQRRERKAEEEGVEEALEFSSVPLTGVNLRDVGAVTRGPMQTGRLYRSSELLSKEEMKRNGIHTILDLRRMDRPCKKDPASNKVAESTKTIITYLLLGPKKLVPEKRLLFVHRAHPHTCTLCRKRAGTRFGLDINVIHADLIPSTVGLRIFQAMPKKVQAKALFMACTGKGAATVMAPAVANPLLLGYKALYRTLLEDSKRGMALALRPFVEEENYPILVHCIHGKDRTGLIIMLLLMLCNAEPEAIVDDYVLSETVLKESRLHDELKLDVHLTTDDVIAATRDTMEETIAYINDRYDDAAGYMSEIGLEDWEIEQIRRNLVKCEEPEAALEPPPQRVKFSFQSFLPFTRRASTSDAQDHHHSQSHRLGRTSSPLPARKPGTEPQSPRNDLAPTPEEPDQEADPVLRRASLANSGPAEIRKVLRKMREEHPELGPITDTEPVDFLRDSPRLKGQSLSFRSLSDPQSSGARAISGQANGQARVVKEDEPREATGAVAGGAGLAGEQAASSTQPTGGVEVVMAAPRERAEAPKSPFTDVPN